jgi:sulfite oxidase
LRVDGLVENPLELTLSDLKEQFEKQRSMVTLQCAGNRRAGLVAVRDIPGEDPWGRCALSTAWWTGVRLADVLAGAGLRDTAEHVWFEAPDVSELARPPQTYGSSIPVSKAMSQDVLLAWSMNDEDLPAIHGAPLRVVVPGYIGARSVKWLQRVTVQEHPSTNYFQATAYRVLPAEADPAQAGPGDGISLGTVALNSDVLSPQDGAVVQAGALDVRGYAHAGEGRQVSRVDVSIDAGATWVQAALTAATQGVWRHWVASVHIPIGNSHITVRAWDSSGASQPESPVHLWNPKGYVNNSWARVDVVGR